MSYPNPVFERLLNVLDAAASHDPLPVSLDGDSAAHLARHTDVFSRIIRRTGNLLGRKCCIVENAEGEFFLRGAKPGHVTIYRPGRGSSEPALVKCSLVPIDEHSKHEVRVEGDELSLLTKHRIVGVSWPTEADEFFSHAWTDVKPEYAASSTEHCGVPV